MYLIHQSLSLYFLLANNVSMLHNIDEMATKTEYEKDKPILYPSRAQINRKTQ